jgi:hypothetical protein
MTDDTFDPRDDLASAHLDGETTPAEAAEVAADHELAARVEGFAAAREAVRAGDLPIDEGRREAAIAAALAAFDDAGTGVVTPITRARRARQAWGPLIGVAAAALLAAVLLPLLARDGSDDGDLATSDADTTTTLARDAGADSAAPFRASEGAEDDAAGTAQTEMAITTTPADLGAQPDLDALATAARDRLASAPTTIGGTPPFVPSPEDQACFALLAGSAADAGDSILLEAVADLDGRHVAAVVRVQEDGIQVLYVADPLSDCAPISSVPL